MNRVLICGECDNSDAIFNLLDRMERAFGAFDVLIHGFDTHLDSQAVIWGRGRVGRFLGFREDLIAGNFDKRRALCDRNKRMLVDGRPQLVIAFPGGAIRNDLVRRALEAHVPVIQLSGFWGSQDG